MSAPFRMPSRLLSWIIAARGTCGSRTSKNFAVCDRWHACLPASTLPNRLMAMSGCALLDRTPSGYLEMARNLFTNDPDDLVYDWLSKRGGWRVYCSGSFFFMQMPRVLKLYEQDFQSQNLFRSIWRLIEDFRIGDVAPVTFIEPLYYDDYRRNNQQATDNHSPATLYGGQHFLNLVWEAIKSPGVWEKGFATISYDEHGPIFDYVEPPALRTVAPSGVSYAPSRRWACGCRGLSALPLCSRASPCFTNTVTGANSRNSLIRGRWGRYRRCWTPRCSIRPLPYGSRRRNHSPVLRAVRRSEASRPRQSSAGLISIWSHHDKEQLAGCYLEDVAYGQRSGVLGHWFSLPA
ncbi:MAG: alkaline phosphatase family protein [Candidatus Binataceae bacterium]